MKRHLITSGCSFTAYDICWPNHLIKHLKSYELTNTGIGSNNNEMISRNAILAVKKLLDQGVKAKHILVGIMWSGYTRKHFCFEDVKDFDQKTKYPHGLYDINPYTWNNYNERWLFATPIMSKTNNYIKTYYKDYQNYFLDIMQTYENVLRAQWYFEKNNIKYFMVPYMKEWNDYPIEHEVIDMLKSEIDYDKWLPVTGEYNWVKENSKFDFRESGPGPWKDRNHPSYQQHQEFTLKVILPWLREKNYV